VQAEFHKFQTHTDKSSFQAQKEHDSYPPPNVPFVACVPAPLVAALLPSSPSAAGVDDLRQTDQHHQARFMGRSAEQYHQPRPEQRQQPSPANRSGDQRQQQSFARRQTDITSRTVDQHLQSGVLPEQNKQPAVVNRQQEQHQRSGITRRPAEQHQQPGVTGRPLAQHQQLGIAIRSLDLLPQQSMVGRPDNGSEEDSNPRSEDSHKYRQACLPTDAILHQNLITDKEREVYRRRGISPLGEITGGTTESSRQGRPVVSGPGDNVPDLSLSSRQPESPVVSNASGGTDVDNAVGGMVGIKRSECVLDATQLPKPPPTGLEDTDVAEAFVDRTSVKTTGSSPAQDPSPTQRHPPPLNDNSSSTLSDKGNIGAPQQDEATSIPSKSSRELPGRDSSIGSVRQPSTPIAGAPQPPPPPPTSPGIAGAPQPPPPPPTSPGMSTFKDPACDPDNPFILKFQDVTSAAFMIRNAITITPCVVSASPTNISMPKFECQDKWKFAWGKKGR